MGPLWSAACADLHLLRGDDFGDVGRWPRTETGDIVRLSSLGTRTAGLPWASICGKWQAKADVAFRDAHARMRCRSAASALSRMRRAGR